MPAATVAVTTLSGSSTPSSSVATLSMAVASPSANITLVGAVPSIMFPDSITVTFTVRVPDVADRVRVNSAAIPSSTGEVPAAMVTVVPVGAPSSLSSTA